MTSPINSPLRTPEQDSDDQSINKNYIIFFLILFSLSLGHNPTSSKAEHVFGYANYDLCTDKLKKY